MKKFVWITVLMALTATVASQAAVIRWSAESLTTGGTEVSTSGTLLEALNFDPDRTSVTIHGVTFRGFASFAKRKKPSTSYFSAASEQASESFHRIYTDASFAYYALLRNFIFDQDAVDNTVRLNGLVVGQRYQIQLFVADSRAEKSNLFVQMDEAWTSPTFGSNDGNGFVVNGVFTADAATQTFVMNKYEESKRHGLQMKGLQINGYQLRAIPKAASVDIPEPAAIGLLLGLAAVMALCQRRRVNG